MLDLFLLSILMFFFQKISFFSSFLELQFLAGKVLVFRKSAQILHFSWQYNEILIALSTGHVDYHCEVDYINSCTTMVHLVIRLIIPLFRKYNHHFLNKTKTNFTKATKVIIVKTKIKMLSKITKGKRKGKHNHVNVPIYMIMLIIN